VRLNTLLLVGGILALSFGLGFLLAPTALLPLYALQPEPGTVLMGRFFWSGAGAAGSDSVLNSGCAGAGYPTRPCSGGCRRLACRAGRGPPGPVERASKCNGMVDGSDLRGTAAGLC
jgi:hypothetical protein